MRLPSRHSPELWLVSLPLWTTQVQWIHPQQILTLVALQTQRQQAAGYLKPQHTTHHWTVWFLLCAVSFVPPDLLCAPTLCAPQALCFSCCVPSQPCFVPGFALCPSSPSRLSSLLRAFSASCTYLLCTLPALCPFLLCAFSPSVLIPFYHVHLQHAVGLCPRSHSCICTLLIIYIHYNLFCSVPDCVVLDSGSTLWRGTSTGPNGSVLLYQLVRLADHQVSDQLFPDPPSKETNETRKKIQLKLK